MRKGRTKPRLRRPRQRRALETVDVIVRATTQILSRDGVEGLTTNRVAEKAGVSIGSVYQYFPDKDALIDEVRRRYEVAFRERMLGLVATIGALPMPEAIARSVRTLIALHAEDPGLHNAVSAAGVGDTERRMFHQLVASWLDARPEKIRRPERALAATMALDVAEAVIHGVALRAPERLADDDLAVELTDLLVRYLLE